MKREKKKTISKIRRQIQRYMERSWNRGTKRKHSVWMILEVIHIQFPNELRGEIQQYSRRSRIWLPMKFMYEVFAYFFCVHIVVCPIVHNWVSFTFMQSAQYRSNLNFQFICCCWILFVFAVHSFRELRRGGGFLRVRVCVCAKCTQTSSLIYQCEFTMAIDNSK